ncbi:MAG: GGDEF domain-containing protein, partial [Succinivibrionaceae bacterium]|nr:GGDEF domain-containing protein [Succinivibrionaceae bacterium]
GSTAVPAGQVRALRVDGPFLTRAGERVITVELGLGGAPGRPPLGSAILLSSFPECLSAAGQALDFAYDYAIYRDRDGYEGGEKLATRGGPLSDPVLVPLPVGGLGLLLAIEPHGGWEPWWAPRLEQLIVALLSLLAGATAYLRAAVSEARHRLDRTSSRDSLTGLFNLVCLGRDLKSLCDHHQPFSLVLVSLRDFGRINEIYGHSLGDIVLRAAAHRIESCIPSRDSGSAYRVGSDTFALLCEGEGVDLGQLRARLLHDLADPVRMSGVVKISPSAAVGCATHGQDGYDAAAIMAVADQRMREDKSGQP